MRHRYRLPMFMRTIVNLWSVIVFTSTMVSVSLSGCIDSPRLTYPEVPQDFELPSTDPVVRTDAQSSPLVVEDFGIDMVITDDMIPMDQGGAPQLRTLGLEFVGEIQSTYNDVEPILRGHYLWVQAPTDDSKKVNSSTKSKTKLHKDQPRTLE